MSKPITVLLAEDEPSLGHIVKESLETRGFIVFLARNGEEALECYSKEAPDVLVLDVMMPKKDGFTLAKEIRSENPSIPILFLTAKSQAKDVVTGFNHGGNDYVRKPFSMEELIVRINALLHRIQMEQDQSAFTIGKYVFNFKKQTLTIHGITQSLTHREAMLLLHLIQRKNEILNRTFILKKLWGNDDFFNARSMDVFITKLRKKLQEDSSVKILNVRGFGYKLVC